MIGLKNGHIRKNLTQKVVNPKKTKKQQQKNVVAELSLATMWQLTCYTQ